MNIPKITIITATYNSVKTLEQTIFSVIEQTYDNIEYIIIDGGSTDGTIDIIKRYADKIAYWISEPDKGIYDAFNKGIAVATGDYIEFLGSDDSLYAKDTIKKIVAEIDEDTDILSGGVICVNERQKIEKFADSQTPLKENRMVPHQGMFVRTLLLKNRMFDLQYKIASDYESFLYFLLEKKVVLKSIDYPVAYYSLSGVSTIADVVNLENEKIMQRYGLSVIKDKNENGYRNAIKTFLKATHIFIPIKYILDTHFRGWRKHHCEWEYCRWCGRK